MSLLRFSEVYYRRYSELKTVMDAQHMQSLSLKARSDVLEEQLQAKSQRLHERGKREPQILYYLQQFNDLTK